MQSIPRPFIKKLKKYLSDDAKITSIKQRQLDSAYYTPELLIKFIWSVLDILGTRNLRILEPAAGIGVFINIIVAACFRNESGSLSSVKTGSN
jgi:hypothetical protein